jgi:hypothetical protein
MYRSQVKYLRDKLVEAWAKIESLEGRLKNDTTNI